MGVIERKKVSLNKMLCILQFLEVRLSGFTSYEEEINKPHNATEASSKQFQDSHHRITDHKPVDAKITQEERNDPDCHRGLER